MSGVPRLLIKPGATIPSAQSPEASTLLTVTTCVVVVAALSLAREVLLPITLAVLLSFVLAPLVDVLHRLRLGRVPSVLVAAMLSLAVILSIGGVIGTQVAGLVADIPRYVDTIQDKVQSLQGVMAGRVSNIVTRLARRMEDTPQTPVAAPAGARPLSAAGEGSSGVAAVPVPVAPIAVEVHQPPASPTEIAQRILGPVLSPLATTGIVFVVAVFILLQRADLRDRLVRLFGARDLHRTMMALDDAGHRLSRYFLTQLALNTAFGLLIGVGLAVIGVPNPVLWGIVALLMRFVPYIGAFLSAGLPLALAAAADPGWTMVAWTAVLFAVCDIVMGQVVEPIVYGHSTGLSPVSVVVAAIFWGWLWGPIGLILSMPLTLCLVVLGRHVGRLEFLDVLFGDQPALTPVESFYQGMLAGNLDEVQNAAELLLKDRSVAAYYDDVAVPGLQLAAIDIERGVLTDAQVSRIATGVAELVGELSDHEDGDAPAAEPVADAWSAPSAILCIAGRGPLDAAASAMLAQLLTKRGIGARVVPQADIATRAALAAIDVADVLMVCLCHVSIAGTPANLRYSVRRLRTRLPVATILVSLPPSEIANDDRLRAAIGAEHYALSLAAAVAACLEQARAGGD